MYEDTRDGSRRGSRRVVNETRRSSEEENSREPSFRSCSARRYLSLRGFLPGRQCVEVAAEAPLKLADLAAEVADRGATGRRGYVFLAIVTQNRKKNKFGK